MCYKWQKWAYLYTLFLFGYLLLIRSVLGPNYTVHLSDPSYPYLYNSIWVTMGKIPPALEHPGLPLHLLLGFSSWCIGLTPGALPGIAETYIYTVWGLFVATHFAGLVQVIRSTDRRHTLVTLGLTTITVSLGLDSNLYALSPEVLIWALLPWTIIGVYQKSWLNALWAPTILFCKWTFAPWAIFLICFLPKTRRNICILAGTTATYMCMLMPVFQETITYLLSWTYKHGYYDDQSFNILKRLDPGLLFYYTPIMALIGLYYFKGEKVKYWLILLWLPVAGAIKARYALGYAWAYVCVFLLIVVIPWKRWHMVVIITGFFLAFAQEFKSIVHIMDVNRAHAGFTYEENTKYVSAYTVGSPLMAQFHGYFWSGAEFHDSVHWKPNIWVSYIGHPVYNGTTTEMPKEFVLCSHERQFLATELIDPAEPLLLRKVGGFVPNLEYMHKRGFHPGPPIGK